MYLGLLGNVEKCIGLGFRRFRVQGLGFYWVRNGRGRRVNAETAFFS